MAFQPVRALLPEGQRGVPFPAYSRKSPAESLAMMSILPEPWKLIIRGDVHHVRHRVHRHGPRGRPNPQVLRGDVRLCRRSEQKRKCHCVRICPDRRRPFASRAENAGHACATPNCTH